MYKLKQKMCKGDFFLLEMLPGCIKDLLFSNVATEFTVMRIDKLQGFTALIQPSNPDVRYPKLLSAQTLRVSRLCEQCSSSPEAKLWNIRRLL